MKSTFTYLSSNLVTHATNSSSRQDEGFFVKHDRELSNRNEVTTPVYYI